MPHRQNAITVFSQVIILTSDFGNRFSDDHSRNEYLCQISLKSLYQVHEISNNGHRDRQWMAGHNKHAGRS